MNDDIETQLVHAGERRVEGAVCVPVFQSATFAYAGEQGCDAIRYIRLSNTPNHHVLHAKLAAVEGGEAALVTASGMAAITTTLTTFLGVGDHILAQDCLYGGTRGFLTEDLPSFGVSVDFVDGNDPASWEAKVRPETRLIYVETMTNPLLEIADLAAVVRFARAHRLLALVDNTFATPVNFRPLVFGFDLVLESGTKYLNGHDDIVAGCVIGRRAEVARILHRLNHLGGSLDPHACFLFDRGLKTLALRVRRQNENALRLARFLAGHRRVERVIYPGLESHPQHARARELFAGAGGVLGFELGGGVTEADAFIACLHHAVAAPNLGGVETLITRPATTSHAGVPPADRARLGISERLIRVAVGIENPDDLCADFAQALERSAGKEIPQ